MGYFSSSHAEPKRGRVVSAKASEYGKKEYVLQKVQRAQEANNCIPCSNSSKDTESISTSLVLVFIVIRVHYS